MVPFATRTEYDDARGVAVLRRLRCSGTLRAVVNLAGGCIAWHHRAVPSCRPLGIGNRAESPRISSVFLAGARSRTSQNGPPRVGARGSLLLKKNRAGNPS